MNGYWFGTVLLHTVIVSNTKELIEIQFVSDMEFVSCESVKI
jgi:hypothetical protein